VHKAGNMVCYYANAQMRIGFPVTSGLNKYYNALKGRLDCFLVQKGSKKSAAMADMITATRLLLHVEAALPFW
jgi:hypothetical protein